MEKTRSIRNQPFCWQEKKILRVLRKQFKNGELLRMKALYSTLTEMDSDFNGREIKYYTKSIATYSGLNSDWIPTGLKKLSELKIIEIEETRENGRFAGNVLKFTPEKIEEQAISTITANTVNGKTVPVRTVTVNRGTLEHNNLLEDNLNKEHNKTEVTSDLTEYSSEDEMQNTRKTKIVEISEEPDEEFEGAVTPKKKERSMTPINSINTGKAPKTDSEKTDAQELRQQSIKLGTHFEQSIGRKMPDKIIQVAGKKGIVEVDLNLAAGKRLITKFGEDTVRGFIGYFFELRGKIAQDQRKYVPVVGNIASLEQKLPAILNFIEAQGVDPFSGKVYRQSDAKLEGTLSVVEQWDEDMRKKKEAREARKKETNK